MRCIVLGVGNSWCSDDGAGPAVAIEIARRGEDARVLDGEPGRLIEAWDGASLAIVVDAADGPGPAGTVHRAREDVTLARGAGGTHGAGVAEAIALGKVLGRMPESLVLYGIVGGSFEYGQTLSPCVAAAVVRTADRVMDEVAATRGGG